MRKLIRHFVIVLCGLSPAMLCADGLPASFTLGKYVPGDWWMYIHFVHNPEHEWLSKEWAEVWAELSKSGIDKDAMNLICGMLSDEQRSKTENTVAKVRDLMNGVRWGDLVAREVVFAERVAPPLPQYAVLMRGAEGSGERNAAGLAAIFQYLASFSDKIKMAQEKRDDLDLWVLRIDEFKYSPCLFRKGDVIGVVSSQSTFEETAALMKGAGGKPSILESSRFKEALKQVKAPEDGVFFFDAKVFMRDVDSFVDYGFPKAGNDSGDREGLKLFKGILGLLDVIDYQIITIETEGRQEFTHRYTRVQPEKVNSPLAKICHQRKPFEAFDKYVPADATSFNVDTSVDLELLYHTILDFVEKNTPDGKEGIAELKEGLAGFGFDFDRDFFSWWSGEMIAIEMPAAVVTPMGGADSVLMVRVKDAKLAAQKVESGVNFLKSVLEKEGQQLLITANPGGLDGFTEVTHPMVAMFVRPVWGVKDEWLMIGSSGAGIRKCLDVAAGKGPSIAKNERFKKEGLIPKGPVTSASFADTSNFAQELGQGLGMASMMGGMMAAGIPSDNPEAKKGKELVQKLFSMLMKLGPVVSKIDFYSSASSVSVWESPVSRGESVTTYKSAEGAKTAKSTP